MATPAEGGLTPVTAIALIGALGVGAQWLAWRLNLPAIVLMLAAGLLVGPVLGILDPSVALGDLLQPIVAIAVAIILFEGGLTLNFKSLTDAATGVKRLVIVGAPVGWVLSASVLHYVGGLSWATSAVFGGIMIVTGPTVIAPLLRQARLRRRPAALLQWEAIVNDPVGALAAVLAFEVVLVWSAAASAQEAITSLIVGIAIATAVGIASGLGLSRAFQQAWVPEYMKVPVLFVVVLCTFAATDSVLHESGLLAVTIMGVLIANAHLPSHAELHRFKEHATILLVSGVFILLAANMSQDTLRAMNWQTLATVAAVILFARPVTVLVALAFSNVPWAERLLVAFTGPRGVVLVAVAGLFGDRLVQAGIEDAAGVSALAFALVAGTVVLHGFSLKPLAKALGLTASTTPGVLIVGGNKWSVELGKILTLQDIPVMVSDPNRSHLRDAREAGLRIYSGDILSEAAEHWLDLMAYEKVIAATDNDAYNTLVATDLAPEFGRENVYQLNRETSDSARYALPPKLGGRKIGANETYRQLQHRMWDGWEFRATTLSDEFSMQDWRDTNPDGVLFAEIGPKGALRILNADAEVKDQPGTRLISMVPMKEHRAKAEGQA
ncbi:cation:proton antiporter [Marivita sp. S6314]|uniref:cation:proton antiporter n=1 Tax=Marivita sp. S6314 TaxID=2926406 RepID=UPI001FF1EFCE|nr:sodium:proton antiporter [Marivita sp. S6314]MCK0148439.1 cation:proton antiporter [Marivita sp. S6314]